MLFTFALIIQQQPTIQFKLFKKFSLAEVTATGKSPTKFFHPHTIIEYYIYYIHHTVNITNAILL